MVSGTRDNPPTEVTLGELICHLLKSSTNRLHEDHQLVSGGGGGGETTRGASCITSAGRVTLAGETTFSHINTLSRLAGTTFCMPRVS